MLILHDIQSNVVTSDTSLLQVSHQVSHSQVSTQIGMEFNEYIRFKQVELATKHLSKQLNLLHFNQEEYQ